MKDNLVHQETYKDFEIEVYQDIDPMDPRSWDNLGVMACHHGRYKLGDLHNSMCIQELNEYVNRKDVVSLPLYLYDHSGITMKTSRFSCPWDSGQVGYIYVTYENIKKNWNVKRVTKKLIKQTAEMLENEVKIYNDYLIGNVYGYVVKRNGGQVDSCWGYIGDWDGKEYGALAAAKEFVDGYNSSKCFIEEGI
jgi:hypothetical protein